MLWLSSESWYIHWNCNLFQAILEVLHFCYLLFCKGQQHCRVWKELSGEIWGQGKWLNWVGDKAGSRRHTVSYMTKSCLLNVRCCISFFPFFDWSRVYGGPKEWGKTFDFCSFSSFVIIVSDLVDCQSDMSQKKTREELKEWQTQGRVVQKGVWCINLRFCRVASGSWIF